MIRHIPACLLACAAAAAHAQPAAPAAPASAASAAEAITPGTACCAARAVVSWGAGHRCRPMSDPPGQPRMLPAAPLGQRATVIDQEWMGRQTWACVAQATGPARWVPTDGYCRR